VSPRHRRVGRSAIAAGVAVEKSHVVAITDARTRRAHLVADAAVAAGRANLGRYVSVCGVVVLAASLTTPESSYCASCAYWRRRNQGAPGRGSTARSNRGW
jgi:hypothetical protein